MCTKGMLECEIGMSDFRICGSLKNCYFQWNYGLHYTFKKTHVDKKSQLINLYFREYIKNDFFGISKPGANFKEFFNDYFKLISSEIILHRLDPNQNTVSLVGDHTTQIKYIKVLCYG